MAFDATEWVWVNGDLVPWSEAAVHASAHAMHYGTGVFEGIRCYETENGPAVFRLDAHIDRLFASAAVYGMEIPYTREELAGAVCETVRRNGFASCYVRPICVFGSRALGLHARACPVEVAILTWPWAALLGHEGLRTGVRVTISPWVKFHSTMMPTTAKACGQYLNSILAAHEATARGFDEALLLDRNGFLAEGPGENLFLVRDGRLWTNDERSSILLGITRDSVLQIARDLGVEVTIGLLRLEDLLSADEAFFTGTAAEVVPIREVDGVAIGSGAPGPVTERLQRVFFDATAGRDPRYHGWLSAVAPQRLSLCSGVAGL